MRLDAFAFQQDGLPPAQIDISRGQIVQAFMVAPVVILLDKGLDLGLKRARQVVIFQQDGPATVLCRSFEHTLCSKGDEPWAQAGRMNFAKKRCA